MWAFVFKCQSNVSLFKNKTFLLVLCLVCDLSSVLGSTLRLTRQLTLQPELGNLALRSDLLDKDRSLGDCGNPLS